MFVMGEYVFVWVFYDDVLVMMMEDVMDEVRDEWEG